MKTLTIMILESDGTQLATANMIVADSYWSIDANIDMLDMLDGVENGWICEACNALYKDVTEVEPITIVDKDHGGNAVKVCPECAQFMKTATGG